MDIKPNLFIIGAMKSGTTSLHNYLDTHPKIAMSDEKEPGYFVKELGLLKGEHWYRSLFSSEPHYLYRGESSTHYTKLPTYKNVSQRMFDFCPNAKLIYIMRDPFERIVSHYWHMVRDLESGGERRNLFNAIKTQPEYLAFSDYATQLAPYISLFGREAIYTLTFEALLQNPNTEVNRIFAWLGLESCELPTIERTTAHNQKPERMTAVAGSGILNRIQYSTAWDNLSHYIPKSAKNLAKKIAYKELIGISSPAELKCLHSLIDHRIHQQITALSILLDRQFPEWPSSISSTEEETAVAVERAPNNLSTADFCISSTRRIS